MAFHLTPYVCRQILRNRPLSHAHCARTLLLSHDQASRNHFPRQHGCRRPIFDLASNNEHQIQTPRIDPGVMELHQLSLRLRTKDRPTSNEEVAKALTQLFKHKHKNGAVLLDMELGVVLLAMRHLVSQEMPGWSFDVETLIFGLQCLERGGSTVEISARAALADILFAQITKLLDGSRLEGQVDRTFKSEIYVSYIRALSLSQQATKAIDIVRDMLSQEPEIYRHNMFWTPILKSLIKHGQNKEFLNTLEAMKQSGVPLDLDILRCVFEQFARQGNMLQAQDWHGRMVTQYPSSVIEADSILLDACITHGNLAGGEAPLQRLLEHDPNKATWDLILRWAAASGKGVDEVERMMDVMARRNTETGNPERPDIDTINGLIRLANASKDPYKAERFIRLAESRRIPLNSNTYALQMEYRLEAEDVLGAYKAFQHMINHGEREDGAIPQINALIQKLCYSNEVDMDAITQGIEALNAWTTKLEPATVLALCRLHLEHNEIRELIDLIHTHLTTLDSGDRKRAIGIFKDFILDETVSAHRAWDAYCIVRNVLGEIDNETRIQIMLNFFKRRQTEYAIHVFGNMRQAQIKSERPSTEAYALCVQGLAWANDPDSFQIVYNMLKLDSAVEPNTYLRNALMLAMTRLGVPRRALEVWDDIVYSREGPTYNSITLVLYAIEWTAMMADPDKEVWTRLQDFGVEPTHENFVAYIGALCGQLRTDDAIEKIVERAQKTPGAIDSLTLGALHNSSHEGDPRSKAVEWIKRNYPAIWKELEEIGRDSIGKFNIDRTLKP